MIFFFFKFEDKKTLGLKLLHVWTNLTTVLLVEGKVRKFNLKLRIEKTEAATHICWQKFFGKVNFFLNNRKARFAQGCIELYDLNRVKLDSNLTNLGLSL